MFLLLTACSVVPSPSSEARSRAPLVEVAESVTEIAESLIGRPDGSTLALNGESGPDGPVFSVENISGETQRVLPVLDGSEMGWRIPAVTLEWRDADGDPVEPDPMGRCGMMNPLMDSDWRTLEPGASLELSAWMVSQAPERAAAVRMTYATDGEPGRALGDRDASSVEWVLRELPEGSWTSEWVALR